MSSAKTYRCLLIILWQMHIVIGAEIQRNEENVTTTELPVSSTSSTPVCISPVDIIPANVKGEATIAFPEEVREIKVTLKKKITKDSNGVTLELSPVEQGENTTPLALLTATLTANTTTATSTDFSDASTPIDIFGLIRRRDLCVKNGTYCYISSEVRWGTSNESGSDHYVQGKRSPLEIQHFFWNSSFENLEILGISVRYRIIQENEVNAKDSHNGTEMKDYLRGMSADDLLRRKREVNDGKIVPGDPATRSDEVSGVKPVNSVESASIVTSAPLNDSTTVTANVSSTNTTTTFSSTSNGSHFNTSEEFALNLTSTTTANPYADFNKTLRANRTGLSYLSQEEFEAFLKGDVQEINVTLGDFLLPPGESYYQYRGDYIGQCEVEVDWLLYVKEDYVLPSVLQILRNIYSPPNTLELQQTSQQQVHEAEEVLRWPYPDPESEHAGMESSGSRVYFNPIVFLAIPIIVLMAFFFL